MHSSPSAKAAPLPQNGRIKSFREFDSYKSQMAAGAKVLLFDPTGHHSSIATRPMANGNQTLLYESNDDGKVIFGIFERQGHGSKQEIDNIQLKPGEKMLVHETAGANYFNYYIFTELRDGERGKLAFRSQPLEEGIHR